MYVQVAVKFKAASLYQTREVLITKQDETLSTLHVASVLNNGRVTLCRRNQLYHKRHIITVRYSENITGPQN